MTGTDFFIIGAPKCGTTALAHYLSEHPQVCFSYPKEPYYWADDFPGIQRRFGIRSLEKYLQLFEPSSSIKTAFGEGSTIYLASSTAVDRILQFKPDAKFIVMLRNPVDLAASLHLQQLSQLNEDEESFEIAWGIQDTRGIGKGLPANCYEPRLLQYRQIASVGRQIDRLFQLVSKDRVEVTFYDDFQGSAQASYRSSLKFLGLSDDNRSEFPRINEGKLPRFKWLAQVLNGQTGTQVSRFLKRNLTGPFRTFADRSKKLLTTKPHARPALSPKFRQLLVQEFREDIQLLSDRTGRQISHWLQ